MGWDPVRGDGSEVDSVQPRACSAGFLEGIEEGQPCCLVDATVLEEWGIGANESSRTIFGASLRKDDWVAKSSQWSLLLHGLREGVHAQEATLEFCHVGYG